MAAFKSSDTPRLTRFEDELARGNFDAVAARILSTVERMVGLRQQSRKIEHDFVADNDADAYGRDGEF